MELRELTEGDLHILVELCRGGLRDAVSPAVLRRLLLDGPGDLPELQLGLWDEGRLAGAALGGLRATADGPVGGTRLLVVAPGMRGHGLGTRLMDELEGRLRAAGATELRVGRLAPNYLWPGLDPRDTAALCLFERRGYARRGDAVNMSVALADHAWWGADDETRLAAAGWVLRRASPADAEALAAWVREHFGELWVWEVRAALALDPPAAFVAECDGRIGAFACHSVSGLPGMARRRPRPRHAAALPGRSTSPGLRRGRDRLGWSGRLLQSGRRRGHQPGLLVPAARAVSARGSAPVAPGMVLYGARTRPASLREPNGHTADHQDDPL
jgi:GNAT superfamily N-acetyltransferase